MRGYVSQHFVARRGVTPKSTRGNQVFVQTQLYSFCICNDEDNEHDDDDGDSDDSDDDDDDDDDEDGDDDEVERKYILYYIVYVCYIWRCAKNSTQKHAEGEGKERRGSEWGRRGEEEEWESEVKAEPSPRGEENNRF